MRRNVLHVLLVMVFFSCSENTQNLPDEFFADTYSQTDRIAARLSELEELLQNTPENITAWVEKGEICKEKYDFVCALDAGAKAYTLDSTNIAARRLYAWTLINKPNADLDDVERAKKHFKYVLSVEENNPDVMVDLANTYSYTGDMETAFKYVNDALRINKNHRDAYVLKGSMYKVLGNTDFALSSYQTAVQVDPDFFMGHLNIGWLLSELEQHQMALEYYQNALDLDPESINALYGIAKSYQDLGDYVQAHQGYRDLVAIDPDFHLAYYNQGIIKWLFEEELDSAVYYFKYAVTVQPEFVRGHHELGEVYFEQGRIPDAARSYSKALELNPDFAPTLIAKEKLREKK
jgi:tetratricopeptide (TPR) repeat protein